MLTRSVLDISLWLQLLHLVKTVMVSPMVHGQRETGPLVRPRNYPPSVNGAQVMQGAYGEKEKERRQGHQSDTSLGFRLFIIVTVYTAKRGGHFNSREPAEEWMC